MKQAVDLQTIAIISLYLSCLDHQQKSDLVIYYILDPTHSLDKNVHFRHKTTGLKTTGVGYGILAILQICLNLNLEKKNCPKILSTYLFRFSSPSETNCDVIVKIDYKVGIPLYRKSKYLVAKLESV